MAKGLDRPTPAVCALVDARDGWRCARCGWRPKGGSRHHRQLRRHGNHRVENLVLLCGSGTTGCHGWVHAHVGESYRLGWLVHSWDDPAAVPVRTIAGWVLLAPDGTVRPIVGRT